MSRVARAKITLSRDGWGMTGRIHALTVNQDQPIALQCQPRLLLKIGMLYEIVPTQDRPERGPWRASTRGYMYHWHPAGAVRNPHAHIGATRLAPDAVLLYKAHYPTGRISLESVIRICITEYKVSPMKSDWHDVLGARERDFETYRSWS